MCIRDRREREREREGFRGDITEARSEGLIELKLVRKPPKVSRGYGGGARAANVAAGTTWGSEARNWTTAQDLSNFGGLFPFPNQAWSRGAPWRRPGAPVALPRGDVRIDVQNVHIPTVPVA